MDEGKEGHFGLQGMRERARRIICGPSKPKVMVCGPGLVARHPRSLCSGLVPSAFSIGKAGSSEVSCT